MTRKLLQNYAMLILIFLTGVLGAQSQTLRKYEARIPFDFIVGSQSYSAGDYRIDLSRPNYLANILAVVTADGDQLQATAVTKNGNRSKTNATSLIFDQFGDLYVLRQIISPEFGFSTLRSKYVEKLAKNSTEKPKRAEIILAVPE